MEPKSKMYPWILIILTVLISEQSQGARILSLLTFPGKSHYINVQPIMQELAERGHEVTVITANPEKNPPPNYNQIVIDNRPFWESFGGTVDKFGFENMPFWKEIPLVWNGGYFTTEVAFNSTTMSEFVRNDNSHYDLVIIELFYNEALYMFAEKYKAPIVTICTMGFTQYIGEYMGNPLQLSYMPHEFMRTRGKLGLLDRLQNVYFTLYDLIGRQFVLLPRHEKLARKHFSHLPDPKPTLRELENNVSLVLINTHYSVDTVRPLVPGIVEIGGVHIKKSKELPQDIKKFIEDSKDGVIFFSLGSNINSKDMPKEKLDMFLNTFKKLKQRILWKWEDDNLPGKPNNVMTAKWLPQTDILAHPNVKIFITHGGLLSTIEAIHFGKPIIGIPVYGDQHLNAAKMETMGIGFKLAFSSLAEEKIYESITKILNDPIYDKTAKDLSKRFRDRPRSPLDEAIFWIEYVIRHKGAKFMKSPLLNLNFYESYMLDVILVVIVSAMTPIFIIKKIISYSCENKKTKSDRKSTSKNKKE